MYVHYIYTYTWYIYIYIYMMYIYIHTWCIYIIYIYMKCVCNYMYMTFAIHVYDIWYVYVYIYIYWWDVHSLLMQRNICNKTDSNLLYSSRQALMQCGFTNLAWTLTMWLVVYSRGQFCNKRLFPGIEKKPSASRKLWLESWKAWPSEIRKIYIITN